MLLEMRYLASRSYLQPMRTESHLEPREPSQCVYPIFTRGWDTMTASRTQVRRRNAFRHGAKPTVLRWQGR